MTEEQILRLKPPKTWISGYVIYLEEDGEIDRVMFFPEDLELAPPEGTLPNHASVNDGRIHVLRCPDCQTVWITNLTEELSGCPQCNAPSILLWAEGSQ